MKGLKSYVITGAIFVSVLGTLLHFAYDFSGNNFIVGLFTPINESIWEHTKLTFFPMLIYTIFAGKKIKKQYSCIRSATSFACLLSVFFIISMYYTYSGIIGFGTAFVDISIFYISVILSFCSVYKLTLSCCAEPFHVLLQILNIILFVLYIVFTIFPPNIPLFISP